MFEATDYDSKMLGNIIDSKTRVSSLLSKINQNVAFDDNDWLAPLDRIAYRIAESSDDIVSGSGSIVDLISKLAEPWKEEVLNSCQNRSPVPKKLLYRLGNIKLPSMWPIYQSAVEVKGKFSRKRLHLSVYSFSGYNFSAEYSSIYKGRTTWESAYDDIVAIVIRAVMSIEPSLEFDDASFFADFITRRASWESDVSRMVAIATFNKAFPSIYLDPEKHNQSFKEVTIYLGIEDGSLSCRIRTAFRLDPTSVEIQSITMTDKNAVVTTLALAPLQFCYYKRYKLAIEEVDRLQRESNGASSSSGFGSSSSTVKSRAEASAMQAPPPLAPAPPPRSFDVRDIGLYLMLTESETSSGIFHEDIGESLYAHSFCANNAARTSCDSSASSSSKGAPPHPYPYSYPSNRHYGTTGIRASKPVMEFEASPCAELMGWGHNSNFSLGLSDPIVADPRPIPVPPSLALQRVRMIACSPRHTILLTHLGNMYSCGENSEGALGVGDFIPRTTFTAVSVEELEGSDIAFAYVAAGSGGIGSHSVAIDSAGALYSWGVAYAAGHATARKPGI